MDLPLTQDIITESELPMGRFIPTTRTSRSRRHFWMLQCRHPGLRLRLFYQTGLVSPGWTTLTMKQASKSSGKRGLQEHMLLLQPRLLTLRPTTIAALQMALCIITGFVRATRLETLRFPMKRAVLHLWQGQPLLLRRRCLQVKSTLRGLIIRPPRQAYLIERKTGVTGTYSQIGQVNANVQSYSDTNGLAGNTKYYYRVRATNGTIYSAYSNETFAMTFLDAPAAPSNLAITAVQSNQVSLSWADNSNNETGFKIQRKQGVTGTYTTIVTTGANVTAYNDRDTALIDGYVYYYRVCATNATGDSAFSNEASGSTFWRNRPLLLRRRYRRVKSTLRGSIIRLLRQDTRLNAKQGLLVPINRSTRSWQISKATAIQVDLPLTQNTITESELRTGRLIPTTRTKPLL